VSRSIAVIFLGPRLSRWGGGHPHVPAASTPGKEPVPIVQENGWAPGPVWSGGKSRPHRDSVPEKRLNLTHILVKDLVRTGQ